MLVYVANEACLSRELSYDSAGWGDFLRRISVSIFLRSFISHSECSLIICAGGSCGAEFDAADARAMLLALTEDICYRELLTGAVGSRRGDEFVEGLCAR